MEDTAVEESVEVLPTEDEDPEPEFPKSTFLDKYINSYRMRTVAIEPFHVDLLAETVVQTYISLAQEFYIRKAWTLKSMAVLQFETEEQSEKAFTELTEKLVKEGSKLQVFHPDFGDDLEKYSNHHFMDERLGVDALEEETVFQRQVILNGVPESITIDSVHKSFPQALSMVDFREESNCSGIIAVEFASKEEAETAVNTRPDFTLNDTCITLSLYPWYANIFGNNYQRSSLQIIKNEAEQFKPLNDELRLDMCKAHKALQDERERLFNRTDIFMQDKKPENTRISALMKPYQEHLIADTRRRLEAGDRTVPEAQDAMIAPVTIIMDAEKKVYFHPTPKQPSAKMKSLVEKAAHKASVKLALLEKVRKASEERNRKAAETIVPKVKFNIPERTIDTERLEQRKEAPDSAHAIQVVGTSAPRGRGRGAFNKDTRRFQTAYSGRSSNPIPTRGGGTNTNWGGRMPRGRGTYNNYKDEEPYQKRFRGGRRNYGYGSGPADSSGKLDEMQALLEERLRRLEEMQLQTLEVQSKMIASATAKLTSDTK